MYYITIFILFFFFSKLSFQNLPSCTYPLTKRLNNGNHLLICSTDIYFLDSNYENIINKTNTEKCEGSCVLSIAYSQFLKEDNNYVVIFKNGINYIFSEDGLLLSNISIPYYNIGKIYSLVAYGHSNNNYYYALIFTENKNIVFNNYEFCSITNITTFHNTSYYDTSKKIYIEQSCQLMNYSNKNVITCFYGNYYSILCTNFDPFNNFQVFVNLNTKSLNLSYSNKEGLSKSDITTDFRNRAVCCFTLENTCVGCIRYYINNNELLTTNYIIKNNILYELLFPLFMNNNLFFIVKYFPETNEFLAGDLTQNDYFYYIRYNYYFEELYTKNEIDTSLNKNNKYFTNIDLIYCSQQKKYLILTSYADNNSLLITLNKTDINLNCTHYYNYNKTECLDNIPNGYFLNDSQLKTLDKCHPYCKTCDKKETENNNNCNSCINNKYLDLGNCVSKCDKGTFIDINDNTIIRCKCNNLTKCEFCSSESINLNLCLTCNKDLGYYPKYNDSNNLYYQIINHYSYPYEYDNAGYFYYLMIDCYKNLDNYFLDNYTSTYMPCYKTCKKCYGIGDEQYNNCIECQINYTFLNESENDTNCYNICEYYYYFDENNKYNCTKENKCPDNYPLLIRNKSKCIDDCKKDNIYKFESNNECYLENHSIKKDTNIQICPKEFPYLNKETNTCIKECNAKDFLSFKCNTNNENDKTRENNLNKIKDAITEHAIDDLLDDILDGGDDITIYDQKTKYQITSSSSQNENRIKYTNISVIKLGECENILKQRYKNISKDDSLLIFKADFNMEGYSTDIVEYEIYHPKTKEKLDLKYCEKNSIEIYQSVSIDEKSVFKHNPNDPFYFDICSKFTTDNNTDITLYDRYVIFVNN